MFDTAEPETPWRFAELAALIREDRKHNGGRWTQPGAQALAIYRIGQWAERHRRAWLFRPACRALAWVIRRRFDIELSPRAHLGRRLEIGHQGGIQIDPDVQMGDACTIHQGVKLVGWLGGATSAGGSPHIGNRVVIGARAVVVGPVSIGDDARIGPNAVVTTDVEPGTVAIAPVSALSRNSGLVPAATPA